MEAPLLERSSDDLQLIGDDGDYLPARGAKAWWRVFCIETSKLWRIGGPIAFQIVCQYASNSVATIFVGHLGDVELSAFSIALSVVATFAFGFMSCQTGRPKAKVKIGPGGQIITGPLFLKLVLNP
ncbi:hypothetical protein DH2020_031019 [Rehmannia glutinosa]|uniref:Uncharacterized protein n=1 Tax=Rehmannia glutinosa TaxID=99300 RepID=A0ABR0VJZ3_REHGL